MLKVHQFNIDNRLFALHTTLKLTQGSVFKFEGAVHRVKEMIKTQPSRYHKKHNYYEIRV